MKRRLGIAGLFIGILIILKLWVGIYGDDEYFFIKPIPIRKTYFYSPRGMDDWKISEMPIEKQKEQKLFDEFVLKRIPKENE